MTTAPQWTFKQGQLLLQLLLGRHRQCSSSSSSSHQSSSSTHPPVVLLQQAQQQTVRDLLLWLRPLGGGLGARSLVLTSGEVVPVATHVCLALLCPPGAAFLVGQFVEAVTINSRP
jgi:hypothetical protein